MSPPSLIKSEFIYILRQTRLARNVCQNAKTLRVAVSSSTLSPSYETLLMSKTSRASVQGLDTPAVRVVFSIYCRHEYEMSRENEETKKSHAGGRGRCFKRRVPHPPFPSGEVSNRPTLSLRVDRQSRKKKRIPKKPREFS